MTASFERGVNSDRSIVREPPKEAAALGVVGNESARVIVSALAGF